MRFAWHLLFCGCLFAAMACTFASLAGRDKLAQFLGATFAIQVGLAFIFGCYVSATTIGEAWVIGKGWVTRKSHPLAYWSALAIPMLFGFGSLIVGVYWCIKVLFG